MKKEGRKHIMSKLTKFLGLFIPGKTDKGSVVTDVFEPNFSKIDDNAESTDVELKRLEKNKLNKGENLETEYDTAVKIVTELKKKQNKEDSNLKTVVKTIVGAINELFDNKFEKGTVSTDYNTAKKIEDKIKNADTSKVDKTITVTGTGILDGGGDLTTNRTITHKTGAGYNHIPVGGASGQVVKYSSAGTGVWAKVNWSEVDGKPSTMPPSSHNQASNTINLMTGYTKPSSTGAIAATDTLNGAVGKLEKALDGKAPISHNHKKNEITDFPSSLKNPNALTISLNGTSQGAYDGSLAKSINITAGGVGAYTKSETDTKLNGKANSTHSHTATQIAQDSSHRYVTDTEKGTWNGKLNKGSLPSKITDAKGLYDLIESNSGLNFDTALLYLNDAGTKYVNKIYFDRNKKGLFKCISQTTSTTNSTNYFVDISNEANSAQLRNLRGNIIVFTTTPASNNIISNVKNIYNSKNICTFKSSEIIFNEPGTFLITLFYKFRGTIEHIASGNLKILNNSSVKYETTFNAQSWCWDTTVAQIVLPFNKNDILTATYTTSGGILTGTAYCTIEKIS